MPTPTVNQEDQAVAVVGGTNTTVVCPLRQGLVDDTATLAGMVTIRLPVEVAAVVGLAAREKRVSLGAMGGLVERGSIPLATQVAARVPTTH